MRGWIEDVRSYLPPVAIGEPMRASGVGQIIASENEDLPVGTLVQGLLDWQEYSIGDPAGPVPPRPLPEGDTSQHGAQRFRHHHAHRLFRST